MGIVDEIDELSRLNEQIQTDRITSNANIKPYDGPREIGRNTPRKVGPARPVGQVSCFSCSFGSWDSPKHAGCYPPH